MRKNWQWSDKGIYWFLPEIFDHQRVLESDWIKNTPGQTQPRVVILDATFLWWLSPSRKSKISSGNIQSNWWSKNPAVWLDERQNLPHPTKMVDPDATFPWWLSPCKTSKTTIDSFDTYWWSKNLGTWLYQKHNWPHTTNSMFTLYQIIVIPVWKSYQKGFPFTLQHRFASSFSYRIVTIMLRSQKWLCYVSDRFSERYFSINLFQPSV